MTRVSACTPHLLLFLVVAGCAGTRNEAPPQRAPEQSRTFGSGAPLRYLVLGDSTAVGVGGDYEGGIAVASAMHLAADRRVILKNLAVSGAQTADVLREQLPRRDGFNPDLVLIAVGANDATHLARAGVVERDLRAIVERLIEQNCAVKIVLTGAPDMSTPPRIPRLLRPLAGWRSRVLNEVFVRQAERHQLTFVPIAQETGPLFRNDRSLFSGDEFHPNDRGYATWSALINPALEQALASQPGHCGPDSEG